MYPIIQFWLQFSQFLVAIIQKINSICANFLWNSKAHKIYWDDVCKTKTEGGLGVRIIDEVTKAMAIKLLWNYINGDTLWAKWMQNKYCKKANFYTVSMENNVSYTWKTLLRARQWCKVYMDRKIVNGDSTNMWFDPWLNGASLIDNQMEFHGCKQWM